MSLSGLWDDVVLHLHGTVGIARVMPFVDSKNQLVNIHFNLNNAEKFEGKAKLVVVDKAGKVLITQTKTIAGNANVISIPYQAKLTIIDASGMGSDERSIPLGIKTFEVKDKQFYLNNAHFIPRGPTVVWHRWMRTKEGVQLGYDTTWFKKNTIQRTKDLGGNYLRFHLGLPPERFLDLCDRYGLVVQFEWSFFHGMPASKESLLVTY
ncbi:hypothetical protein EZ428_08490 [Pedobacter frigiditerrae]|uniref:Uncharacterized protein n=2 Tax=Pedobacter frigiditerrae TaxID=2530452 RepID=A0A4R0MX36_9SPHI|nr:hypothetical protein EZ428_08490 [Pedobacter frigiditerrae]